VCVLQANAAPQISSILDESTISVRLLLLASSAQWQSLALHCRGRVGT